MQTFVLLYLLFLYTSNYYNSLMMCCSYFAQWRVHNYRWECQPTPAGSLIQTTAYISGITRHQHDVNLQLDIDLLLINNTQSPFYYFITERIAYLMVPIKHSEHILNLSDTISRKGIIWIWSPRRNSIVLWKDFIQRQNNEICSSEKFEETFLAPLLRRQSPDQSPTTA